ncbi:hypothetical protein NDU88_005462 [Pleurodeles waltl]|uniref:Uncharacterized protein n=1 Tax=Pleurodeles waltl TaxID=8319 RepID=A0AAV7VMQ2_PLEWA|nr:hypothetical protein NDU88_005462 [Pleurodeles waltl]
MIGERNEDEKKTSVERSKDGKKTIGGRSKMSGLRLNDGTPLEKPKAPPRFQRTMALVLLRHKVLPVVPTKAQMHLMREERRQTLEYSIS